MSDVFDSWSRMMAASMVAWKTGMQAFETSHAAGKVIAARVPMINTAIRSPLTGNYTEMGRMVPEKVEALSRSGSSAVTIWWKAQAVWMGHMQHLGMMIMAGLPPKPSELADLGAQMTEMIVEAVEASASLGAGALAPFHSKATSNARRLTRGSRRA